MIGGCVGDASGGGVTVSGAGIGAGVTGLPGAGVATVPGGLTGPAGGGTGGFTCAAAASAMAQTAARLVNGAITRRKRLLIRDDRRQAIFCAAGSRDTADARSVL